MSIERVFEEFPIDRMVGERILNVLKSKEKYILLRAPAGSGKTTLTLAYAIVAAQTGARTGIFFRTLSQVNSSLRTLRKLIRVMNPPRIPKIVPIVGKIRTCINPPQNAEIFPLWCEYSKCPFMSKRRLRGIYLPNAPESLRQVMMIGRENDICPYYIMLNEALGADILLATQSFFINDKLFERLLPLNLAVVDEAHGLMHLYIEIDEEKYKKGAELAEIGLNKLSLDEARALSDYRDYVRTEGVEVVIEKEEKRIKIIPPIWLIRKRVNQVSKLILMSATIYPTGLFKLLFAKDIDVKIEVIPGLIQKSKKARIFGIIDDDLSSKRELRTPLLYNRYAVIIRRLILKIGTPTLILTPGYEFAQELAKRLGYPIVKDPKEVRGDIVISVLRGRLSEGIDIKFGKPLKLLIIAGLPYRPRTSEFVALIKVYSEIYGKDPLFLAYALEESDMLQALIQALGRARRSKGVSFIIDFRIAEKDLRKYMKMIYL